MHSSILDSIGVEIEGLDNEDDDDDDVINPWKDKRPKRLSQDSEDDD